MVKNKSGYNNDTQIFKIFGTNEELNEIVQPLYDLFMEQVYNVSDLLDLSSVLHDSTKTSLKLVYHSNPHHSSSLYCSSYNTCTEGDKVSSKEEFFSAVCKAFNVERGDKMSVKVEKERITIMENVDPGPYLVNWNFTGSVTFGLVYQNKDGRKMLSTPNWFGVRPLKTEWKNIQYLEPLSKVIEAPWPTVTIAEDDYQAMKNRITDLESKLEKLAQKPEKSKTLEYLVEKFTELHGKLDNPCFALDMDEKSFQITTGSSDLEITVRKTFENE